MLPASDFTWGKYCQGMEHTGIWKSRHIVEDHKRVKYQEMVTAAKQNPQISAKSLLKRLGDTGVALQVQNAVLLT